MKYYLYVSDTKVDMLYSQIPESIRNKIAAEIKIEIPLLLNVSFKDKEKQPGGNLYTKLDIVLQYMSKHLDIGTFVDPKSYFRDKLPMRWVQIGEGLAYFTYSSKKSILGLGGSADNLVERKGASNPDLNPMKYSNDQNIIAGLSRILDLPNSDVALLQKQDPVEKVSQVEVKHTLYAVEKAVDLIKGPIHSLEFLARRLVIENTPSRRIILGSPIYVAYTD